VLFGKSFEEHVRNLGLQFLALSFWLWGEAALFSWICVGSQCFVIVAKFSSLMIYTYIHSLKHSSAIAVFLVFRNLIMIWWCIVYWGWRNVGEERRIHDSEVKTKYTCSAIISKHMNFRMSLSPETEIWKMNIDPPRVSINPHARQTLNPSRFG